MLVIKWHLTFFLPVPTSEPNKRNSIEQKQPSRGSLREECSKNLH